MEERDAELARRAADGDRICRQLLPPLMGSDAVLDGSIESLRLIDTTAKQLRGVVGVLDSVKDSFGASTLVSKEAVYFMIGAYLGEMARRELGPRGVKARWEAGGGGQISMARSHLVIARGAQEERWAVFYEAREWLNGGLEMSFHDSMRRLLSLV